MRTIAIFVLADITLVMLSVSFAKEHKHAPLSPTVLSAKTVYLDNRSGYENMTDRAYDELQKWGRFRVVGSAKDADLVLLLSASVYNGGYRTTGSSEDHGTVDDSGNVDIHGSSTSHSTPVEDRYSHLYVLDPKSGETLWSDTKPWAFRSATRALIKEFRARIEQAESN